MSTYNPFARKALHLAILATALATSGLHSGSVYAQSPTPTPTPTPTATPSATPSASPSASPSPSPSPSPGSSPAFQGFALEDNDFTITGGGASSGFSQTASISANGVVDHISNVPTTDDVGIPSFSFELVTEDLSAGVYPFRVAVIFDKEGSQSRIEAKIETLELEVLPGGAVVGRIPAAVANQGLRVLGRNGSGTLQVSLNIANTALNGPVSISGNQVTFNAERLIERIRNSHASFNTVILEEFDQIASYDYRIVVQQKAGGPETANFGTAAGAVLSPLPKVQTGACALPCATSAETFELNSGELAAGFTNAYSVTGSFNVVPFVPPVIEEGGGGPTPPPLPDDIGDLLGDLEDLLDDLIFTGGTPPTDAQLALIEEAFGNLETQLGNAETLILSGGLSIAGGFDLLEAGGNTFVRAGDAAELGGDIDVGSAADTLGGFADLIGGMFTKSTSAGGTALTSAQIDVITSFTEDKLTSAANMITTQTSVADVEKMMESTADLLNKTLEAGGELSPELVTAAVQIALKAVNNIVGDVAEKLGITGLDITKTASIQELLREQPSMLAASLTNTPALVTRRSEQENNQALASLGSGDNAINAQSAELIVAALGAITNPNNVEVPGGSATSKLLSALARAFGGGAVNAVLEGGLNMFSATSFAVDVDAITGALRVRADSQSYAATSTAVRLVPATIPEGVSYLSDGRAVAVADGVAIELAPAAVDVLGFAAATTRAGFPATFRSDGSVELALANNQRFSGTFAYDNLGASTSSCGAITFGNPTGALNADTYAFTMRCANGITQRIVPFIGDSAFYRAVADSGLAVRTDRNTGAVTIGTVGRFKPSFFVNPLTSADQTFLTQNGTNGFAFRSRDLNGDGRADYEVISSTGVQIMYRMP